MSITNPAQKLYNVGLSYKKADVDTRSKFSISKENQIRLLQEAKSIGIDGVFVLSTCNRTEVMGFASHPFKLISLLCKYSGGSVEDFVKVSTIFKGNEAINHLFRIATGLESQILGDYEIIAQLKKSFKRARKSGTQNANLERLCNLVLQASKQVKNNTKFSSGVTSVSYVAIQHAINHVEDFNSKNILVLGLGDIGKNTCRNLLEYTDNSTISVINRTLDKAENFGKQKDRVQVFPFENLSEEISKIDVLFVSTGADKPIVTKEHFQDHKEILILDLSIPKNVSNDVAEIPNVTLVNVDTLSKITDETLEIRKREIVKVEDVLDKHKEEYTEWLRIRKHTPALNALKKSLQSIQNEGIDFHSKKNTNFDIGQAEIISSHLIQKITTQFAKHMRENNTDANQTIEVLQKVFHLEKE